LYRVARTRRTELVLALAGIYLLLFYSPLVWFAASPLRLESPPAPADAIVVFAGGVGESGQAGGGYQERAKQAVDLYRAGHAKQIVISSGFIFAFREAEVMKTLAVQEGVPADAIQLETRARDTHEMVTFVRDILAQNGWRRILLVSSPYHMRRAVLTWRRAAPGVSVVPVPVRNSQFYVHDRGASFAQIRGIAQEYAALAAYWWRGWI
jgi:uncharacterized SAM-binding protein YcdF (DUF218 family)